MQQHSDTPHTVLVVEEDPSALAFLADNLTADGYRVLATGEHERALALCAHELPDAALVDVNAGAGRRFAATVRAAARHGVDPRLAVILLGSVPGELEAVRALDAGADDYVLKPYSYPELRARLRAQLARAERLTRRPSVTFVGALRIDDGQRRVWLHGEEVKLSAKEYALLRTLAGDPQRVYPKQDLLRTIWGYRDHGQTRTLDSHACRLRTKLAGSGERFVVNVWGVGYRLTNVTSGELHTADESAA